MFALGDLPMHQMFKRSLCNEVFEYRFFGPEFFRVIDTHAFVALSPLVTRQRRNT